MDAKLRQALIAAAIDVRQNAYAPYSHFAVGAALLCESGEIVQGCNVENGAYGLSLCAERVAASKAISDKHSKFTAIAIAASPLAPPCGACRQFLAEFNPALKVISIDATTGEQRSWILSDLLPDAFRFSRQG